MKNTRNLIIILSLATLLTLGCGGITDSVKELAGGSKPAANSSNNSAANGSGGNTAILTSSDTGIPECDKLAAKIEEKLSNPDASYIEKGIFSLIKSQVITPIRDEIANKTPQQKKDIAVKCTEAYDKMMAQEAKDEQKKQ